MEIINFNLTNVDLVYDYPSKVYHKEWIIELIGDRNGRSAYKIKLKLDDFKILINRYNLLTEEKKRIVRKLDINETQKRQD